MKRGGWLAILIGFLLLLVPARPARAACSISATGVAFGSYNVFAPLPLDSAGSVTYNCVPLGLVIRITLDRGSAPSFDPRQMRQGTQTLAYNLYLDPARQVVWRDSPPQVYTAVIGLPVNVTVPVYGRIPSGQDVAVGSYSDTITVTILP